MLFRSTSPIKASKPQFTNTKIQSTQSSKNAKGRGLIGQRQKNKNLNLREESPTATNQAAAATTTTDQHYGSDLRGKEQQ